MVVQKINEMKNQGLSTGQIIQNLRQAGVSPKEINEALSQSQIPNQNYMQNFDRQPGQIPTPDYQNQMDRQSEMSSTDDMQQSSLSISNEQETPYQPYSPQEQIPQRMPGPSQQFPMQQQEYYQEYTQPDYQTYPEYTPSHGLDIETITDLATQIIEDKMQEMKEGITNFARFKKQIGEQIIQMEEKLERLNTTIQELQMAIIRKVGEYGENIEYISNELRATQDSFAKVINPLMDKRQHHTTTTSATHEKETDHTQSEPQRKPRKPDGFEEYLR